MTNEDPYFRYVSDEHNYYIEEKTPFIQELEQQVTMTSVEEPNLLQKIDDTIFPNKISVGGTKESLQLLQKLMKNSTGKLVLSSQQNNV